MRAFQGTHGTEWESLKQQMKMWRNSGLKLNYQDTMPSNFSAGMQRQAEEAMLTHARWLREATGAENLCIAGGVALNCVANSHIAREAGFDQVFVPPAPGDDGIAVGCALYGAAANGDAAPQEFQRVSGTKLFSLRRSNQESRIGTAHSGNKFIRICGVKNRGRRGCRMVSGRRRAGTARVGPPKFPGGSAPPRHARSPDRVSWKIAKCSGPFAPVSARRSRVGIF